MTVETFMVVHLDGKNRMVGMTTCSIGSMTASLVHRFYLVGLDGFEPSTSRLSGVRSNRAEL